MKKEIEEEGLTADQVVEAFNKTNAPRTKEEFWRFKDKLRYGDCLISEKVWVHTQLPIT